MAKLMLSVMGAFAEFERSLLKERQKEGIEITKKKGLFKGRKKCLSEKEASELRRRAANGEKKSELTKEFKISRETLHKYTRAN
jgi:DNA invertase Pin-like site-specific DNA recombinase